MRRVGVTGIGIVSSIGSTPDAVLAALRTRSSGMVPWPAMAELGFRCQVYAPVRDWQPGLVPKRSLQSASAVGQYALSATLAAIEDAKLDALALQNDRTAAIIGTAFGGLEEASRTEQLLRTRKSPSRAGATGVLKMMNSSAAGNVAVLLGIQGRAYSISSAFASGADCIGHAYDLIRLGIQDLAVCGGAEEAIWEHAGITFATTGALPTDFNDRPEAACRPFDRDRQGLILSEGAGILILEPLDQARARGAHIYAEVIGYGAANDGADMFRPSGTGLRSALNAALADAAAHGVDHIDYVNAHATGTLLGDVVEARVLHEVFGSGTWVSATKGQTGHSMGAAGAQEAVFTLLMLRNNLLAPTLNLDNIDPACEGIKHVLEVRSEPLGSALTVSIGMGGSNACLAFRKIEDPTP